MIPRYRFVTFLLPLLLVFVSACGPSSRSGRYDGLRGGAVDHDPAIPVVERSPWELWPFEADLSGVSLRVEGVLRGDKELSAGRYAEGLIFYRGVSEKGLVEADREALAMRIASAELSLGRPKRALSVVSDYYGSRGLREDRVSEHFALLLAYAYGASGDVDQSLAWFSRTERLNPNRGTFSNAAEWGARALLAALPSSRFEDASLKWIDDPFISGLVGRERRIRSIPEYQAPSTFASLGFWKRELPPEPVGTAVSVTPVLGKTVTVGIMLPLSGTFAALGGNTKNGIDLAIEGAQGAPIRVVVRDTQGDPGIAGQQARELVGGEKVDVIVGPLLSEDAQPVREVAVSAQVAQLSLSKGSTFETGGVIFRLGATTGSQMDALLDTTSQLLGLMRYAVLYPDTPSGFENASTFKNYLNAKGLQLSYEAILRREDELRTATIIRELEVRAPEAIFIADSLDNAGHLLSLLPPAFRERIRPMGPATWDDPVQLANSQALFEGAVFVSPFFAGRGTPAVTQFVDSYRMKFGKRPDFLAAQGFDAMSMIINAARAVSQRGISMELAIKEIEAYEGLTGRMRVDVSGEVNRAFSVVQSKEGELREIVKSEVPLYSSAPEAVPTRQPQPLGQ